MTKGKDLRKERIRASVSQIDMAKCMNVSQQYVSRVELSKYVNRKVAAKFRAAITELSNHKQS